MEERGSDALTFALLAERSGLSGSTLVQRFGTKQGLIHAAIAHAWDVLEQRTRELAAEEPKTPAGAIAILSRLSRDYGDIDSYADKLRLLREDLRNPEFRARGKAWTASLAALISECFAKSPRTSPDLGMLLVAQWQGALLLWAFSPEGQLDVFVQQHLTRFVRTYALGDAMVPAQRRSRGDARR
jgi:AcrR family transcriptional regulator